MKKIGKRGRDARRWTTNWLRTELRFVRINFYLKLIKFIPLIEKKVRFSAIFFFTFQSFFSTFFAAAMRRNYFLNGIWSRHDGKLMEFFIHGQSFAHFFIAPVMNIQIHRKPSCIFIPNFLLTCGHILHWYFLPPPFASPDDILVALIGCGTTRSVDGCPCRLPGELLLEATRNGPEEA